MPSRSQWMMGGGVAFRSHRGEEEGSSSLPKRWKGSLLKFTKKNYILEHRGASKNILAKLTETSAKPPSPNQLLVILCKYK